jgi:membrane-bound lytic murein transglycosylase D
MFRHHLGRRISRRQSGSIATFVVATVAAAGVVMHGPFIQNPVERPVASLMQRAVAAPGTSPVLAGAATRWDLPNLDHALVDKWIARFTGSAKKDLLVYLERMAKYTDMIEAKAEERGVPKDLVYLATIESGGNPSAKSPVGARGLWQFMAPTARQYGLTSSERLNPVKSTDAALEYLGDLHRRFGSWYLAAAAYNAGQGRVGQVLKRVTGKTRGTDADFYRIAAHLPKETRDYVPKLIAVARIAKDPAKYGLPLN